MSPPGEPSRKRLAHPGGQALGVLAGRWTVAIVDVLSEQSLRMAGLEGLVAGAGHGTVSERLRELVGAGIVAPARVHEGAAHLEWSLTERGRELREITGDATILGRRLGWRSDEGAGGERVVRRIADPYVRAIRRALVDGPMSLAGIERSELGLAHSTLLRRAGLLVREGLLTSTGQRGERRYALADDHRRLVRIPLLAARCERRWAGPDVHPPSDVRGLVHMIAPIAPSPSDRSGALRLHVTGEPGEPPIDVSFARGKLMVHPLAPTVVLAAQGRASALDWGRALLRGDPDRIEAEGDRALLDAVVLALSDAIAV